MASFGRGSGSACMESKHLFHALIEQLLALGPFGSMLFIRPAKLLHEVAESVV
eukprot:CAMPEP_0185905132 /NCGR_PEP_ID=MMETSP0196C-20130402/4385_1 /TAXON_ID=2932 /ORGANISM="Alexandrium fundyense, Strain CCMP1719" /LENGTH=52 /DNA_ID=CAMNT_0028624593 /DNA_START=23 /DNA_END=178 /DNA_ORIENTATION=+